MMAAENVEKLHALLRTLETVMVTTVDDQSRLISRPMILRVGDFGGTLFFLARADSRIISHIAARSAVNISSASTNSSVSLTGTADFTTNYNSVAEHWHSVFGPWLPRGTTGAALIEVTIDEARFWSVPGVEHDSYETITAR
ncbi:MAG: pyridoxamine 5'-phosphate oxidase family protein [Rhodococcus sp.]|jgi:general stress protein 26|nr:pyridoxamine 5'-phosphate oxidase family protein [Rhodococcus sp. (in: high G+C Gram-positive bacteria)]